jgi:hypothetical protein
MVGTDLDFEYRLTRYNPPGHHDLAITHLVTINPDKPTESHDLDVPCSGTYNPPPTAKIGLDTFTENELARRSYGCGSNIRLPLA